MKGLYAKARNGSLSNFTGVDSRYEIPLDPGYPDRHHADDGRRSCRTRHRENYSLIDLDGQASERVSHSVCVTRDYFDPSALRRSIIVTDGRVFCPTRRPRIV